MRNSWAGNKKFSENSQEISEKFLGNNWDSEVSEKQRPPLAMLPSTKMQLTMGFVHTLIYVECTKVKWVLWSSQGLWHSYVEYSKIKKKKQHNVRLKVFTSYCLLWATQFTLPGLAIFSYRAILWWLWVTSF